MVFLWEIWEGGLTANVVRHALCLDQIGRPLDLLVGHHHHHIGNPATDLLVLCLGRQTHFGSGLCPDPVRVGTRVLGSCSPG